MNNDFEIIKKNNSHFFYTINEIVIKFQFEKEEIMKELNNSDYRKMIFHAGLHPNSNNIQLYIMDTNHKQWYFNIISDSFSFQRGAHFDNVSEVYLDTGVTVRYTKDKNFIHKKDNIKELIYDFTNKEITLEESELILLDRDIDLKNIRTNKIEDFILPLSEGKRLLDIYKERVEKKNSMIEKFNIFKYKRK